MVHPEEQPKEILLDGTVQQQDLIVPHSVITGCSQNENSAGIDTHKGLKNLSFSKNSVAVGGNTCDGVYHNSTEDDINDALDAEHHDGSEESKSESAGEQEIPRYHETSFSCAKGQSIPEGGNMTCIERLKKCQLCLCHKPSSCLKWMFRILLFSIICSQNIHGADGAGDTVNNFFPSDIKLNCRVTEPGLVTWLNGPQPVRTVDANKNLIIDYNQSMNNYVCEKKLPDGVRVSYYFSISAFNSCDIFGNDNFAAFKRGEKCIHVELKGKVARGADVDNKYIDNKYILCIQNRTMEITPEEGSGSMLQHSDVTCKVKESDMNPARGLHSENETTTVGTPVEEKSSVKEIMLSVAVVAIIGIAGVAFVYCCVVKRVRKSRALQAEKAAASAPCLSQV